MGSFPAGGGSRIVAVQACPLAAETSTDSCRRGRTRRPLLNVRWEWLQLDTSILNQTFLNIGGRRTDGLPNGKRSPPPMKTCSTSGVTRHLKKFFKKDVISTSVVIKNVLQLL